MGGIQRTHGLELEENALFDEQISFKLPDLMPAKPDRNIDAAMCCETC